MEKKSFEILNTKNGVQDFLNTDNFVKKTCEQLNKDLIGFLDYSVEIPKVDFLQSLINQLVSVFYELESSSQLPAFIYRVDLSEKLFKAALMDRDFYHLGFQVVQREAQKVFLKEHFKTNE